MKHSTEALTILFRRVFKDCAQTSLIPPTVLSARLSNTSSTKAALGLRWRKSLKTSQMKVSVPE